MSDVEIIERDDTTGRFLNGTKPGPGRPRGARSKFSEAFIQDLHKVWEERGIAALEKCAAEEPGVFIRTCASLMPKDISLSIGINATDFANRFQSAYALLGNPEPPMLTKPWKVVGRKKAEDRGG